MAETHLTPEILSGLGKLRLQSQYLLDGALAGMHRSPYQGFSSEFDQYRGYSPGDDPRFFDWRVFGRTGHAVVKRFRDETNTALYLLVDTSASMGFAGKSAWTKIQVAGLFAAALAHLGHRQRDALSLHTGAKGLQGILPPRTGGAHFQEMLNRLEALSPKGETDLESLFSGAAQRMKSGSMVFIFTDLWQKPESILAGLKQVRAKNEAVSLVHLTTPEEQSLRDKGDILFRDLETGTTLRLAPEMFESDFHNARQIHQEKIRGMCHDLGVVMETIDISSPLESGLRGLISAFSRQRSAA
jgi:uncharacterized protein (DUF58 family)